MRVVDLTREHPFQTKMEVSTAQTTKTVSRHTIEAFVARLMKSNRKMEYNQILDKASQRFETVQPQRVYDAVHSLLSSHIIRPEQGFANQYVYN